MARNKRRCKVDRRLRHSKALAIQPLLAQSIEEMNKSLKLTSQGFSTEKNYPKNAFLNPEDPEAIFP